jgi:hypothetical protein
MSIAEIEYNVATASLEEGPNILPQQGLSGHLQQIYSIASPETFDKEREDVNETLKLKKTRAVLNNLKHQYEAENNTISYPLTKWAVISQLIFVMTGIVIPFNYHWWAPIINSQSSANSFSLIMFYIGVSSAFFYILLEIWHSLYGKTTGKISKFMAFVAGKG